MSPPPPTTLMCFTTQALAVALTDVEGYGTCKCRPRQRVGLQHERLTLLPGSDASTQQNVLRDL